MELFNKKKRGRIMAVTFMFCSGLLMIVTSMYTIGVNNRIIVKTKSWNSTIDEVEYHIKNIECIYNSLSDDLNLDLSVIEEKMNANGYNNLREIANKDGAIDYRCDILNSMMRFRLYYRITKEGDKLEGRTLRWQKK